MAKKMIILILLVTLSSCNIPEYKELNRCVFTIIDNEPICACQKYNLNKFESITDMYEVNLKMCEDLIGFNVKDWTEEITPKGREIFNWINDNCSINREKKFYE